MEYFLQILLLLLLMSLVFISYFKFKGSRRSNPFSKNWPILKLLPFLVQNTDRMKKVFPSFFHSFGDTFVLQGPIFSNISYIVTCNPYNIEYILKTNFSNFPKGPDFLENYDIFGDELFTTDSHLPLWPIRRKHLHTGLSAKDFKTYLANMIKSEVEFALLPLLVHLSNKSQVTDLQDVFLRLAYDNSFRMIFGVNPKLLNSSFPVNEYAEGIDVVMETVYYRGLVPNTWWKLMRWLKVGWEGRYLKAWRTIDHILENMMTQCKKDIAEGDSAANSSLLYTCMKSQLEAGSSEDEKHLRDWAFGTIFAASDTSASGLTWFFFLVSQNPTVEEKIMEELNHLTYREKMVNTTSENKMVRVFDDLDELKNLVYLHAALCESLRMYPPVHLNQRTAAKADVLPDGTSVRSGTKVLLSIHATGRAKSVWGEDSKDFKPERWINEDGKLRSELMSKFFVFNVGPRICIGKDMAFNLMKLVAATILFNFHLQVVDCQPGSLKRSMVLFMNNGLKVKIYKKRMTLH